MARVQSIDEIYADWRAEGYEFRPRDVIAEQERQAREALREHESDLLEAAELPDASEHLLAVAEQIRDHREAGNYTTQG